MNGGTRTFADASSEAREVAKAFPHLARLLNDYAEKFDRAARERRCLVRVHDTLQRGERDGSLNAAVIASALSEIESGGFA